MKNILKLSLAAVTIAALSACGGGGSSDAADAYVGTWKSVCFLTTSPSGNIYSKRVRTLSKTSAIELASTTSLDSPFSDAACANVSGVWSTNPPDVAKYVLGVKAQFLGAAVDSYVFTSSAAPTTTYSGYMTTSGTQMYLADSLTGSAAPTSWGVYSPYTKQ
jgi:hypothetical protein